MDKEKILGHLNRLIITTEVVIKNCKAVGVSAVFHEEDLEFYREFRRQILLPEEMVTKILKELKSIIGPDEFCVYKSDVQKIIRSIAMEAGIKLETP